MSYVKMDEEFIDGLNKWIDFKKFDREKIVEVFAGTGKLGNAIGLSQKNITDDHSWRWTMESIDDDWVDAASDVYKESATETIKRFVENNKQISLLIMGFPPDGVPDAYLTAKELSNSFPEALILYIGTESYHPNFPIATESFFEHIEDVEEEFEKFDSLVRMNYVDNENGVVAALKKFKPSEEEKEGFSCT